MKRGLLAGMAAVALTGTVWTEEINVVEAGPHHRVMQVIREEADASGETKLVPHQWQELATGLNRWDDDAKAYVPAKVQFEQLDTGHVIARKTAHQLILSPELNAEGAVELWGPDNLYLRSTVLGVGVVDSVTGTNYLLATLKETAELEVVSDSEVLIRDAFDTLKSDIRYSIGLNRFEQDLILREQVTPELLADLGINPKNARLFLMTEFFQPPQPQTKEAAVATASGQTLVDTTLNFGSMSIGAGRAFSEEEAPTPSAAEAAVQPSVGVGKEWKELDGRQFLIETVQYEDLAPILEKLPILDQARADTVKSKVRQTASLPKAKTTRQAKAPRFEHGQLRLGETKVAGHSRKSKGLAMKRIPGAVIDYQTLITQSGLTLQSDVTYSVVGSVTLSGTTTIEGGTVVKYAASGSPQISLSTVVCRTDPGRYAIFTAKDDDSVGEVLPGSTGTPSGYYATTALSLPAGGGITLEYVRIAYAQTAMSLPLSYGGTPTYTLRHLQILHCQNAIVANGVVYYGTTYWKTIYAGNILMQDVTTGLSGSYYQATCDHWTVDGSTTLLTASGTVYSTATFRNCLFANVGNTRTGLTTVTGSYVGFYNSPDNIGCSPSYTTTSNPFQTAGAGAHYLTTVSGFRNLCTASIDSTLATSLKKKTTYPPVELTTAITSDTVLQPQAQRDTDTLDLGFHYDPLDYVVSGVAVNNATLVLTNGVSLGVYGSYGLELQSGAKLRSEGIPLQLNQLVRYQLVQEQANNNYTGTTPTALFKEAASAAVAPDARFRFTSLAVPSNTGDLFNGGTLLATLAFTDCQLTGSRFFFKGNLTARTLTLTNNLFERVTNEFGMETDNLVTTAYNNLFRNSGVNLKPPTGSTWTWKDNVFDFTLVQQNANPISNGNNGYTTNVTKLTPTGSTDVTANTFTYVTSTLGRYYLSSSSPLLNVGSRTAGAAGLYHYTTQSSQAKEAGTQVDIGFHRIALTSGLPTDTDGDGIPDYMEDRNGNGSDTPDSGETNWKNSYNGTSSSPGLTVFSPLK